MESLRRSSNGRRPNASKLSGSTLRITRSGPKETNFAIVDIPGLIRGKLRLDIGYINFNLTVT